MIYLEGSNGGSSLKRMQKVAGLRVEVIMKLAPKMVGELAQTVVALPAQDDHEAYGE